MLNLTKEKFPQITNVKLADFGLACNIKRDCNYGTDCFGTFGYMAPEMLNGSGIYDQNVDLWSLGVLLFNLVTGKMPFDRDNLVAGTQRGNPKFDSMAWRYCSKDLKDLTSKLLEKNVRKRLSINQVLGHQWMQ